MNKMWSLWLSDSKKNTEIHCTRVSTYEVHLLIQDRILPNTKDNPKPVALRPKSLSSFRFSYHFEERAH